MSKRESGCTGNSISNVVIVEGVLLFCDADICQMFDACMWLETDMHRCAIRRNARRRKRNQEDQLTFHEWYELEIWANFQQYRTVQLTNAPNAFKIDASLDLRTICGKAAGHIDRLRKGNQAEAAESDDERWTGQDDGPQRKQMRQRQTQYQFLYCLYWY